MSPGPRTKGAARYVIAVAALVVVGCSSDTPSGGAQNNTDAALPKPSQSATPDGPPSSTSPADQAGQLAIDAYLGMWDDYAAAAETSDWQSPLLDDHALGEALSVMSRGLYASSYNGLVSKGRPVLDPRVTAVDPLQSPTTVTISDCGDSSDWLRYDAETGELAEDEAGGLRAISATVELQMDGAWMVSGFAVQELGSC